MKKEKIIETLNMIEKERFESMHKLAKEGNTTVYERAVGMFFQAYDTRKIFEEMLKQESEKTK